MRKDYLYQGKTEFTDKYLGKPVKWTTDVTKESLPNDILMSVRAPVGPVNINKDRICIGRGLAAIRCKNGILVIIFSCIYWGFKGYYWEWWSEF